MMEADLSPLSETGSPPEAPLTDEEANHVQSLGKEGSENGEEEREYFFGCGPCHPGCLQTIFRRKKVFTFLLASFSFLQSAIVNGFISVVISTIERRYSLSSTQAGFMVITYDIAAGIAVIFVSYFGSKTHQPRVLGIAVLLMAIGTLVFALPHFLIQTDQYSSNGNGDSHKVCSDNRTIIATEDCSDGSTIAYVIFIASNILLGIAATPIYTVGVAYLDEIVFPQFVSLHVGVISTTLITAPLIGFGLGSAFLSIYVDPLTETSLMPSDPAWVGAWWMPFVISSLCLFILAVPFLMFPCYLPDSAQVRKERAKEMAKIYPSKYVNESSTSITFKMFPIHIKRLLFNPSFILIVLGLCSLYIFVQGLVSFGPKFYEVQYILTASTAGLLAGGIGVPGAILGTLTGAFVVFCCKMKGRRNALFIAGAMIITFFLSFVFFLHCPSISVVGVTENGFEESSCGQSCNCTSNVFDPVCGGNGQIYISPCQAGCLKKTGLSSYENCLCVIDASTNNISISDDTAMDGYCQASSCLAIIVPAVIILLLLTFAAFVIALPYLHFILRVVSDEQRALALGCQSAFTRTFGNIPGPLIFGALFDASCILWEEECGRRGNCWLYDNDNLSIYIISLAFPCIFLGALFFFLAWLMYPKPKTKD